MRKADNIGNTWKGVMQGWQEDVKKGQDIEDHIKGEIKKCTNKEISTGRQTQEVLQQAALEEELQSHRKYMHPGYFFCGDNVDMRTHARATSRIYKDRDVHMFQINAYQNRVTDNSLDPYRAQGNPHTVPFSQLLPSSTDIEALKCNLAFLVAKVWQEHLPALGDFGRHMPKYICHQYVKETSQKTSKLNVGVLRKNEQYNDQMVDIVEFVHQFVPGTDNTEDPNLRPITVPMIGDYLTVERGLEALSSKRNGRTPSKKLQGLTMEFAEFHNQAELLKVKCMTK